MQPTRGFSTDTVWGKSSTPSPGSGRAQKNDQKIQQLIVPETFYKSVKDNEKNIKALASRIAKLGKALSKERNTFKKSTLRSERNVLQKHMDRALQERMERAQTLAGINPEGYSKKGKSLLKKTQLEIKQGNERVIKRVKNKLADFNTQPFFRKKQFSVTDLGKMADLMQEVDNLEKNKNMLDPKSASKLNKLKMKLGKAVWIAHRGSSFDITNLESFIGNDLHRLLREQERVLFTGKIDRTKLLPIKYALNYLNAQLREETEHLGKLKPIEKRLSILEERLKIVIKNSDETKETDLRFMDNLLSKLNDVGPKTAPLDDKELRTLLEIKYGNNHPEVQQKIKQCEEEINLRSLLDGKYEKLEREGREGEQLRWAQHYLDIEADSLRHRISKGEFYLYRTLQTELAEIGRNHPELKERAQSYAQELKPKAP